MKRVLFSCMVVALAFSAHLAHADQRPVPCTRSADPRVGCFDYREDEVYKLWTTPEATLLIRLADGETIDAVVGADVCRPVNKESPQTQATEKCNIMAGPRGNFLFLKFLGCVIPEPVQMNTKTADGKSRMYNFEVHTEPQICGEPTAMSAPAKRDWQLVGTAEAADSAMLPGTANLKYVTSRTALTVAAKNPIFYSAKFRYPEDDAAKRRETAHERVQRENKEQVDRLLDQEVDFATHDPWRGDRNYNYKFRGSSTLKPAWGWDNDYSTAFVFPAMQAGATLYRVMAPDNYTCKDDDPSVEEEQLAHYDMRNDTMIITGTSRVWRLRRGKTEVMDICDLNYNPVGSTPGSGTASPWVQRIIKGTNSR
jgi:type IV secretory pathway VirB9-like protein